jgi:hypothetical protein
MGAFPTIYYFSIIIELNVIKRQEGIDEQAERFQAAPLRWPVSGNYIL